MFDNSFWSALTNEVHSRYSVAMFYSKVVSILVLSAIGMPFLRGQEQPVKLAAQARFDLTSSSAKLEKAEVLAGNGQIQRMSWIKGGAQEKAYTANFAVTRFGWNEIAVRFLPGGNGPVELKLMGPWEQASAGKVYRQEVLWDSIEVSGASLKSGDFEAEKGSLPPGWVSGGGVLEAGTAFEGKNSARTWHNQTLSTTLEVKVGEPVTVKLYARAYVPPGYPERKSFAGKQTAAHKAAKGFMRGANFGNYLEVPPSQNWGLAHREDDLKHMEQEGFDHVRLPIGWHHYAGLGPEFKLTDAIFAQVDNLVTNALKHQLNVMVNIHHFDAFTSNPEEQKGAFMALWRQIAEHYAQSPAGVAFELLNEPKDKATTTLLNPIYAEVIREIRKTNPTRVIFVGPGKWNSIDELSSLMLPDDDENLIVTVHCYEPFYFTHQGATWAGGDTKVQGIQFPGPPSTPLTPDPTLKLPKHVEDWIRRYNTLPAEKNPSSPAAFRAKIRLAREWSEYYGRPVHMGEFGCFVMADPKSRANFYASFREVLEENKIGWAVWDWKAGFKYWDPEKGEPAPGLRKSLFGKQ
jgi:endoglucanase